MTFPDFQALLQRTLATEPLRLIIASSAVVVWLVTHIAIAIGYQGFGPEPIGFTAVLAGATAAALVLTEFLRRFVYAPATVATLVAPDASTTL